LYAVVGFEVIPTWPLGPWPPLFYFLLCTAPAMEFNPLMTEFIRRPGRHASIALVAFWGARSSDHHVFARTRNPKVICGNWTISTNVYQVCIPSSTPTHLSPVAGVHADAIAPVSQPATGSSNRCYDLFQIPTPGPFATVMMDRSSEPDRH
jgi:hypothetical protein